MTNPQLASYSILKSWNLSPFTVPLNSGKRQECPFSPILFLIVLKVLATVVRQQKQISIHIGRKEVKLSLFADDMILYMEKSPSKIIRTNK